MQLLYRREDGTFVAIVNGAPYHITEDDPLFADAQAQAALMGDDLPFEPPPPPPPPPPPYVLAVTLIWMRMTDEEAEEFDANMAVASPLRLRRAFNTAQHLTDGSELFNFVKDVLTSTFTATKANDLMQPMQPGEELMASAGEPLA